MKILLIGSQLLATALFSGILLNAKEPEKQNTPIVILKLDDMCTAGAPSNGSLPVSPRWQKLVDYLLNKKLKASIGVMGFSLEEENQKYFDYLKELDKKGFELWNHGYKNRKGQNDTAEFEKTSLEEQKQSLEKTQKLMKEKTGITLKAFGPHWSGTSEETFLALEQIPEIKMVFFYSPPSKKTSKFIFERNVNLESKPGIPDFENFKKAYEKFAPTKPYICMQGHPNMWNTEEKWNNFEKIIDYLVEKGSVFMTPSEYLESLKKN